jgi:hypothetical protein
VVLIIWLWHGEQLNVHVHVDEVVCSLSSHGLDLFVTWVIVIREEENAFRKALFLDRFELLVAHPKCLVERRLLIFCRETKLALESVNLLLEALDGGCI